MEYTLIGLDVSKHQGNIDWTKAAAGQDFVIIRAGYGRFASQEDPCFKKNIEGAFSAGLPVGVYWYSYAATEAEARQEAEVCLSVISPYRDKITLPVFFDQEYEPDIKAMTTRQRTDCCLAFIKKIQAAGYQSGLYASYDWFKNMVYRAELLDYPAWVAQYANKCRYTDKNLYMWQYTSTGKVNGISGNVDQNEGYFELTAKNGWQKSGSKWYYYENGQPVKGAWRKITGSNGTYWYYLGKDGVMLTGLQKINNKLYMLNPSASNGVPEGACIITNESGAIV